MLFATGTLFLEDAESSSWDRAPWLAGARLNATSTLDIYLFHSPHFNSIPPVMSLAEKQVETSKAFIEGYNEFTIEGLLRARSDDCIHAILPVSLGRPPRTNNDYKMFFGNLKDVLKDFKVHVRQRPPRAALLT